MFPNTQPRRGDDPSAPGPLSRAAAEEVLATAKELAGRGEFEAAAAWYRRLVGHRDADLHVAGALGLADSLYRVDDEPGALQAWIVAASAPETPLSWLAWKQLAAARVREQDLVAATRAYREAERRAPPQERPEIASRLGWLTKEMGNEWQSRRYFGRSRDAEGGRPIATYAIVLLTVVVSLIANPEFIRSDDSTGARLLTALWLDKDRVAAGEWYRLLSVVLVHGGILHLALNMYALYLVGPIVERLYGPVLFIGAYLLAAAGGSTLSFLMGPAPGVGASGGIFGLFAMLFVTNMVYRPVLARQARAVTSRIGMFIAINLVFGFGVAGFGVAAIDNFAHIGGLLAGAWLGLVVPPRGALTLSSFWQGVRGGRRPAPGRAPEGPARAATMPVLLRGAAVVLLVLVLAAAVMFGASGRARGRRGGTDVLITATDVAVTAAAAGHPGGARAERAHRE